MRMLTRWIGGALGLVIMVAFTTGCPETPTPTPGQPVKPVSDTVARKRVDTSQLAGVAQVADLMVLPTGEVQMTLQFSEGFEGGNLVADVMDPEGATSEQGRLVQKIEAGATDVNVQIPGGWLGDPANQGQLRLYIAE